MSNFLLAFLCTALGALIGAGALSASFAAVLFKQFKRHPMAEYYWNSMLNAIRGSEEDSHE